MEFELDFDDKETAKLYRRLERLQNRKVQSRIFTKALRAGMAVWKNYLKKNLPRTKWKRLIRSLTVKQDNVSEGRRKAIGSRVASLIEAGAEQTAAVRQASKELRKADQFGMVLGVTGAA